VARARMTTPPIVNILTTLPAKQPDEAVTTLLTTKGVRIERIVSYGNASQEGFWYDQDEVEWIIVLAGHALLTVEGESAERELRPGDSMLLPSHCRHRVSWTHPDQPTVWLAVFVDADLLPHKDS
jgi:cupin 2 domain-containing protein